MKGWKTWTTRYLRKIVFISLKGRIFQTGEAAWISAGKKLFFRQAGSENIQTKD